MKHVIATLCIFSCALLLQPTQSFSEEALPQYEPAHLESGSLTSVGSDSMDELVSLWVQAYKKHQSQVTIDVESQGSASAPAALIEGTANLGPMSRNMTAPEVGDFEKKYGFKPTQIRTALIGISVYVSKANPLGKISLTDLDAIYSVERKRGAETTPTKWSQLGVSGSFGNEPIVAIGQPQNTYLTAYFRQKVLLQGEFLPAVATTTDMPSMLNALAANTGAIGFGDSRLGGNKLKTLSVSSAPKEKGYQPTITNMLAGNYPLARFLNVYIVRFPGQDLDPATKDFLKFVLSREGQEIVGTQGFISLPASVVNEERKKIF